MGHIVENPEALYNPDKTSVAEYVKEDPFTYPRPWGRYKGVDIIQYPDRFQAGRISIPCKWPSTGKERVAIVEKICEQLERNNGG